MKVIVFQHAPVEHPGVFRDFFREDNIELHTVELDEGETIPDLEPFDAMVVMGGPQDVWQEDQYPWLRAEKQAIRNYVMEMRRPYLGICLGHQLLAESVGGRVGPSKTAEIGVLTVSKSDAGKSDTALLNLPDPLRTLQWHGAEVTALPDGAEVLAKSDVCPVQAFRFGPRAYGLQFHVEVTDETVTDWAAIPEYAQALEKVLGAGAVPKLESEVASELPQFRKNARALYDNLKSVWAAS